MTRDDLIFATAATLLAAFALGWLAHLVFARLTRPVHADPQAIRALTSDLHKAEAELDDARSQIDARDARLADVHTRLNDAFEEIEELRSYIDAHIKPH